MTYPGGKAGPGVYQTIINQIPAHDFYCAPFLGHDAVLRFKAFAAESIGIDLDPKVLEWWQKQNIPNLTTYRCNGIEWLRHYFGYYRHGTGTPNPTAPAGAAQSDGPSSSSRRFVFIDPPYPMETRKGRKIYKHELTAGDHAELLATVLTFPADVACMICTYPNEYYRRILEPAGWRTLSYFSIDRRGNRRQEQLWLNYPPPATLHDYQFIGNNKRQRETIRRRCRNWVAGLKRMAPNEREAVLQAITTHVQTLDRPPRNSAAVPAG